MEIKYLVMDVDGTMTDGSIYYDETGNQIKKFNCRDAAGFFCARQAGIKLIVLSGRRSETTARRMKEMQVDSIFQDVKDKRAFLEEYMKNEAITSDELAYVGDDFNDYGAMLLAGFRACPQDAEEMVKNISDYVSKEKGGDGVIRDVVKFLLEREGNYIECLNKAYGLSI